MLQTTLRIRCRNQRCRTKLAIPTDNHHKAFCAPYCYDQFYSRKCLVCEKPLPEGHRRQLCSSRQCKLDYRNFRASYVLESAVPVPIPQNCQGDSKSPCGTGTFSGIKGPPTYRIVAGPKLSPSALWAATLHTALPGDAATLALAQAERVNRQPRPHWQNQPGDLATQWVARELARREAEDAQYVAEDEARLRALEESTCG